MSLKALRLASWPLRRKLLQLRRGLRRRVYLRRQGAPPLTPEPYQFWPYMRDQPQYAKYQIGEWSYGTPRVMDFGEGSTLIVGRFCSIASATVIMLGGDHRVDWVTTYPFSTLFDEANGFSGHPRSRGDVRIGNDVWIGDGAFIRSGVTIGDGAVIAARSVVTSDVAPYTIVGGNPARLIRQRFTTPQIEALLALRWWDWPLERIKEAWPLLLSNQIDAFIERYYRVEAADAVSAER